MNPVVAKFEESYFPKHIDPKMPETIATIDVLAQHPAQNAGVFAHSGSAVSSAARAVQWAFEKVTVSTERSQALFGSKKRAIMQIWALVNECSEAGWDGENAQAVALRAAHLAIAIIRALPENMPLPELAPEPDGSIALDWIQSRYRLFSLSIGESNRLAYAWIDGGDRGHAVARFDERVIPTRILQGIKATMRTENAAIGSA